MRDRAPFEGMAAPTTYRRPPDRRELFAEDDLGADEPSTGRTAVEWTLVVAGAVIVALVVKTFVLQAFFIPSASMEPTLRGGNGIPADRVLVDKVSYRFREPSRGDIVVFEAPADFPDPTITDLIKRVIGVPGDEIVFENNKVKINGQLISEPYLSPGKPTQPVPDGAGQYNHRCVADDPCKVPAGHLWVMGDNRTDSEDSRYIGPIDRNLVVGKAFVLVWPFGRFSGL
jgi:signal peptidase I